MYEGDPGRTGEDLLVSHSGDLEVSIPASAAVEIKAHSVKGESDEQLPNSGNDRQGDWDCARPPFPIQDHMSKVHTHSSVFRQLLDLIARLRNSEVTISWN